MKKINTDKNHSQFPSFFQGFNRRWFADDCHVVYLCKTTEGVERALEEAIGLYGRNVKIKCGGHCYEDFVFNENTKAIIDVTGLDSIGFDEEKGYFLEAGGTNWAAFKGLFRDYGKVLPSGSCYSVGLGGHICGGGYGLLSRLNGLTVDWLTGVEIVVKNDDNQIAHSVYVSQNSIGEEKDLFWAQLGGGGGNFGVITKYYFKKLPDAPNNAFISSYAFQWADLTPERLGELLLWFKNFASDSNNWNQFGIFKLNHEANDEIQLVIQTAVMDNEVSSLANEELISRQSAELAEICTHNLISKPMYGHGGHFQPNLKTNTINYTFYEAAQTLNGSGPNQRGKYKSAYMRKAFTSEDAEILFEQLKKIPKGLTKADMVQSLLQIDSYGGRINTIDSKSTAIAQRSSVMKLQYQTYWTGEKQDAGHLAWIREFYEAMYRRTGGTPNPALDPTGNLDGCYYNYPDSDLNDIVGREGAMKLYFLENLDRLKLVKRTWDPNDYFNSKQSIPL